MSHDPKKSKKSKKSKKKVQDDSISFEEDLFIQSKKEKYLKDVDESLILPEKERYSVGWNIPEYSVSVKKPCRIATKKNILVNQVGYCAPGTLTAILGPSGAGKTSLIRILGQRIESENYVGKTYINGNVVDPFYFRKVGGFVAQDDVIMGSLKTFEAVKFAADLKLPESTPEEDKVKLVNNLLNSLGLDNVAQSLVGFYGTAAINSAIKGRLSGGERKRVSICMELVNNPKILYLDEPTSGLDSYAALTVVEVLRKLAFMGRTVVCSIHQPSTELMKLFDNVIVLSQGQTAYAGPLNKAPKYFEEIGYKCPKYVNPADHFIETVQVRNVKRDSEVEESGGGDNEDDETRIMKIFQDWSESRNAKYNEKKLNEEIENDNPLPILQTGYPTTYSYQLKLLMSRMFLNIAREPRLFRIRLGIGIFFAILSGLIWLRLSTNNTDIIERISSSFFLTSSVLFSSISGPLTLFAAERGVFYREYNSGLYSSWTFYISKLSSEVPLNIIVPVVSCSISYWMIGFNDQFVRYVIYTCFLTAETFVASGIGIFLASVFDDPSTGMRVMPVILLPVMLFSGFFLNSSNVPVYFLWLKYISPLYYTFSGVAYTIFSDLGSYCDPDELKNLTIPIPEIVQEFYAANISCTELLLNYNDTIRHFLVAINDTLGSYAGNMSTMAGNFSMGAANMTFELYNKSCSICPINSGNVLLNQLDIKTDMRGVDFVVLCGMFVILNICAYLSIHFCRRSS